MIRIDGLDVYKRIDYARNTVNCFLSQYDFDPLDVLKGGSGFPDASPEAIATYNAAAAFLDSILKAYSEYDKVIYRGKERSLYI